MKKNAMRISRVRFPQSANVCVNMMPFVMGDHSSLPPELVRYADIIDACGVEQRGKVGYLTVTESTLPASTSQRRGGIHTESPGRLPFLDGQVAAWGGDWGGGGTEPSRPEPAPEPQPKPKPKPKPRPKPQWSVNRIGGIYMASTISGSCRLWDTRVDNPGHMGNCEHLRDSLGQGTLMRSGELWWMTDRCPHESLQIPAGSHRQFFRLVTNQVSVWFAKHSTPNPLGVLPDCLVVDVDKFALVA